MEELDPEHLSCISLGGWAYSNMYTDVDLGYRRVAGLLLDAGAPSG